MAIPVRLLVREAIDDAYERIGKNPATLDSERLISCQRSIRLLLTDWNNDGVMFWRIQTDQELTIDIGDETIALPANVMDVLDMAVRRDDAKIPMSEISRIDWFAIPDRINSSGMPTRYWVERNVEPPVVHFYPKAENDTDVLVYDCITFFAESTSLSTYADVRRNWDEAFVSGLAVKFAEKWAADRLVEKQTLYGGPQKMIGAYAMAKMGDRERGDTVFVLNKRRRQHR